MYELLVTNDRVRQYGIRVGTAVIPDVTPHRWEAEALLETMRRCKVSEVHAMDVVEDWLAEREPTCQDDINECCK